MADCPLCEGHGEYEVGTEQDSFGNWDTVMVPCEKCDGSGKDSMAREPELRRRPAELNADGARHRWWSYRG